MESTMADEVAANHNDISAQLLGLPEKKRLKVGARLVHTLEGNAHDYFIAVDRETGVAGLYYHDQAGIDPSHAIGSQSALTPEAPRELVATDDTAVPEMIEALKWIHDAESSRPLKQVLTVLAVHNLAVLGGWPDPRAARQVLDLLPRRGAKLWRDVMRGMVAAAVAWLRAADTQLDALKSWLDKLLKTNQGPFILGFTASNAMRWFYVYSKDLRDAESKHDGSKELFGEMCKLGAGPAVFMLHRPDPSWSVTEDQAKEQAFQILRSVRQMNPAPLAKGV
jgi:hypothetical protein